jgi:hypothetical protein
MRIIKRPDTIIPINGTNNNFGISEFINFLLNLDERFNKDGVGVRSAVRIEKACREEGDIKLETNDWTRLKEASEKPSSGYGISPARLAAPYIEAIEGAKEE